MGMCMNIHSVCVMILGEWMTQSKVQKTLDEKDSFLMSIVRYNFLAPRCCRGPVDQRFAILNI